MKRVLNKNCADVMVRGCVTPKQIENLKAAIEDDLELFDGYDELPEAEKEKMRRALEQGHVDDEDWKWVGFRLRDS
jgi:hypothetical protein